MTTRAGVCWVPAAAAAGCGCSGEEQTAREELAARFGPSWNRVGRENPHGSHKNTATTATVTATAAATATALPRRATLAAI